MTRGTGFYFRLLKGLNYTANVWYVPKPQKGEYIRRCFIRY